MRVWIGECNKCSNVLWVVSRLEEHYGNASPFAILFTTYSLYGKEYLALLEPWLGEEPADEAWKNNIEQAPCRPTTFAGERYGLPSGF